MRNVVAFALVVFAFVVGAPAHANAVNTTPQWPQDIPKVLSENDVQVWRDMFRLQRLQLRKNVVQRIPQLDDKSTLMGHLIAARLLHPQTKANYSDLQAWLQSYRDLPQAPEIYALANQRAPKGAYHPRPRTLKPSAVRFSDYDDSFVPRKNYKRSKAQKMAAKTLQTAIRSSQWAKVDDLLLKKYGVLGYNDWAYYATYASRHALGQGNTLVAQDFAKRLARQPGKYQAYGHWMQGLAHYAAGHFRKADLAWGKLAELAKDGSDAQAQAHFWQARALAEENKLGSARVLLTKAALSPHTFYGQLAAESVGKTGLTLRQQPSLDAAHMAQLMTHKALERVIALVQIGEFTLAQDELRMAYKTLPKGMDESLLALCQKLHLPHMSYILARNLQHRGTVYADGLYPLPAGWLPKDGLQLDPALLFAMMKQESAFRPTAKSHAGARGLMQLMPATAREIRTKKKKLPLPQWRLYDPVANVTLAQDYLLTTKNQLDNGTHTVLLDTVMAYNAGAGNVRKWRKRYADALAQDPLLYLEMVPFRETRRYAKKVMANLWAYQQRLGRPTTTLAAFAQQALPVQLSEMQQQPSVLAR